MKRIVELASRVYPSDWSRKYGTEFRALLEDVEPSWRAVLDVLQGGVQMQVKHMSLVKLTIACAGAGLLIAASVAFSIKDTYQSSALIQITGGTLPDAADTVSQLVQRTLSTDSLNGLIEEYGLYKDAHGERPADVVRRMREDVTIGRLHLPGSRQPSCFVTATPTGQRRRR